MATRVLDQDKVVELLRRYRPSLVVQKAAGGNASLLFTCPFHTDTNPSFNFALVSGSGWCYACKTRASFDALLAKFEQTSEDEVHKLTRTCYKSVTQATAKRKVSSIDVSLAQIHEWHKALLTDVKLNALMSRWGWSTALYEKYLLGSSDGRLVIPMMEGDAVVGLKYYSPGSSGNKYQNVSGSAQCCWPLENLERDTVYLVEGEKDCLTMLAAGFNAVTFTGGAGSIPMEYIRYFAGKTVYIIYDIDEAGRKGAVKVANVLNIATKKVYIVELPLDGIPKGDLTDAYMRDPATFSDFISHLTSNTDEYQSPAAVSRVVVPVDVHRTYLEDIVRRKLFYRRVNMKVRIVNTGQHETTIVPRDVELTCNRDYKEVLCQGCPAFFKKEGLQLHVKPEYPELLSMIGNNVKVQRAAINSMTAVVEGCTKFKIEQKTHQALYPIVVIPAIEANKKTHNYSMVTAWALDVASKENIDYDIEGVVLANPDTQKMELVCYTMTEDEQSIDSFELTADMITQLEIFKCIAHPSPVLQPN